MLLHGVKVKLEPTPENILITSILVDELELRLSYDKCINKK